MYIRHQIANINELQSMCGEDELWGVFVVLVPCIAVTRLSSRTYQLNESLT